MFDKRKLSKVQVHYKHCYDKVNEFIDRVSNGTNLCTDEDIQLGLSRNRKNVVRVSGLIDDQADHSSTQHTNDEEEDDDDEEELGKDRIENDNSLEAFKHPHSKESKDAKQDRKVSFRGLTIHTEQQDPSARAALFLYWPRSKIHLFLNKLLFIKNLSI